MSGSIAGEGNVTPNLTPILDMVFQLITFFMLVLNFKAAELDQTLTLPVVGSAAPAKDTGSYLVLNVKQDDKHPEGFLAVYGNVYYKDAIDNFIKSRGEVHRAAANLTLDDVHEGGKEIPTTVIIRADQTTPFHCVNRVIGLCQDNGYRSFALKTKYDKPKRAAAP
jgi:biopolymer transport protein ExbD